MPKKSILMGILAIVAGLLVLIWPDLVRWVIGIFLIVWGVLAVIGKSLYLYSLSMCTYRGY